MLVSELKKLQLQSELVSIERNCHDEELTGFICEIDESITSMQLYTDDGNYDGFTIFKTNQIVEVFWGNREHQAISNLIAQSEPVTLPRVASKGFQNIIVELSEKFGSVCIHSGHYESKFDIGVIEKYDEECFKVHTYATQKTLSRMYKILLRESISRVVINSPYQTKIVGLHSAKI